MIPENDIPAMIQDYSGVLTIQYRLNSFTQLPLIHIDLNKSKSGVFRIEGCGKSFQDNYSDQKELIINLNPLLLEQDCIYQGAIVPLDQPKDYVFSIMVQRYANNYNHLPFPEITNKINSDETVSFTEIDDKIVNEYKNVNVGDAKEIRIYTVAGRYVVCHKDVDFWECQR